MKIRCWFGHDLRKVERQEDDTYLGVHYQRTYVKAMTCVRCGRAWENNWPHGWLEVYNNKKRIVQQLAK